MNYAIGIQARTNSKRFPGKVLKEILGIPLIAWVIEGCKASGIPVWLLTSNDSSDDELSNKSRSLGAEVFRGPLVDVWSRYASFLDEHKFSRVIRINGDSPLISPNLILHAVHLDSDLGDYDLTTNVFPRTFPKGQSVEVINSQTLHKVGTNRISENNREHITSFFYEHSPEFKIRNFSHLTNLSNLNLCVDIPTDLVAIEDFLLANRIVSPSDLPSWSELALLLQELRG